MSVEQNKAVARRWNDEVWGARNLDAITDLIAENAILHDSATPEPLRGPAGARGFVETMLAAFPDTNVEILHLLGENDMVTVHFQATGTHQGSFQGIEPTGNRVEVTGMAIKRVHNAKIVEEWQIFDALGLLRQLDAIPA